MAELLKWFAVQASQEDRVHVVSITLFVGVLCLSIVAGHLLKESRWTNESINALVTGCITGFIVLLVSRGKSSHLLRFDEELFFIYLLPPIIFNAGFQVKKKQFFRNFVAVVLFGIVGVFFSFAIISIGCWLIFPKLGVEGLKVKDYLGKPVFNVVLVSTIFIISSFIRFYKPHYFVYMFIALGTIFSSTDTVCTLQVLHQDETPLLYSLVFGEGVVNDATSVVLFRAVQKFDVSRMDGLTMLRIAADFFYLFFTSTILGIVTGLLTAYTLKSLYFARHSTDREIGLMALMAYLSYMLAELCYLSGILTVFFCGIAMSHYAWHNVTENSRITTKHAFATMSFIAETFIFVYVGMDAIDIEKWSTTKARPSAFIWMFSSLMSLILLGRASFVFPLSALANKLSGSENTRITLRHQVVIWWAGLMRGAVSIALAFNQFTISGITWNPLEAAMIINTIIVVLFSTTVFGILTKPLIGYIIPHHMRYNDISDPSTPKDIPFTSEFGVPLLQEDLDDQTRNSFTTMFQSPTSTIHHLWRKFDDGYMRPIFGGQVTSPRSPFSQKEGGSYGSPHF